MKSLFIAILITLAASPTRVTAEDPDANACLIQCKQACVADSAYVNNACITQCHDDGVQTAEECNRWCSQYTADFLAKCKNDCYSETCGTPM